MQKYDIYKIAGLIIRDRRVLASRSHGKDVFIQPGGKVEGDESPIECLERELLEEQGVELDTSGLAFLGTYYSIAAGHEAEALRLRVDAYIVNSYEGILAPQSEVAENKWLNAEDAKTVKLGSIFEHDIIPELKRRDLID